MRRIAMVGVIVGALTLGACGNDDRAPSSNDDRPPGSTSTETEGDRAAEEVTTSAQGPKIRPVPPAQWAAMTEAGMVRPGCPVSERRQLRRVDLDYVDFAGDVQRGYLVVNADTAETTARIFTSLFEDGFPIRRMEGVENYDGDTLKSLQADNTSAYNCRRLDQINAPVTESPHANGRAIDINPRENPWMDLRCECWSPGPDNQERTEGPGKILRGGLVWQAFRDEGWIWQNIDVADYMHFDTGYPSVPYGRGPGQ